MADRGNPLRANRPARTPRHGRGPVDPDRWIRIWLRNGTVAFVPTEDWAETVAWWLREKWAKKAAEGIVWAEMFAPHLDSITTGNGLIDRSGPWIISRSFEGEWGRG